MKSWLRVLIPAVLVLVWFAGMGVGGPTFGKLSDVSSNDQTDFLPASADATEVQAALGGFLGEGQVPAIVVVASETELDDASLADLQQLASEVAEVPGVVEASPAIVSDDGRAVEIIAVVDSAEGSEAIGETVESLRVLTEESIPAAMVAHVTGPAGFTADIGAAFSGIDGLLLLVAIGAVLLILIIVYRSPLLPLLVLSTAVAALCVAILIVYTLADAGLLQLSGQTQGILFILVVGAATDYALLYTARFRETLVTHPRRWDAAVAAWRGAFEPILASGGTVIAGLLCLLLSDLNSNKQLGPVAAIGIACAVLAALTMLPALLALCGRAAFWPFAPKPSAAAHVRESTGIWSRVGALVDKRPRVVWIASVVVLGIGALGLTQVQADGVPSSEFVTTASDARDGQAVLDEHFPGGSGSPTYVLADEGALTDVADAIGSIDGVSAVGVTSDGAPGGVLPVPTPPGPAFAGATPTVSGDRVLLQVTLADAPDSDAAQLTVREMRSVLAETEGNALVGGATATAIDTNDTSIHDRNLIIPVVLGVILIILALLLRSIVAPIMLILTTVLSFATALGVAALILQALGKSAMDASVPLFSFVFLVALGVDYNIFLMTRVREEALRIGHRRGVLTGLTATGGVITSAGIVLAATFAALGVIPVLFLLQIAIIVALGVLIDTVIVRSLLVPALALDIGPRTWWPSKLARERSGLGEGAVPTVRMHGPRENM